MTDTPKDNNTVVLGGAAQGSTNPASKAGGVHNALPIGTRMGEFEIIGLVGEGGFGIVYLAQDHSLERKVALKEYMPSSLAARGDDASVIVRSERHQETFEIGRRSFVNEARLLAQFDHAALVKVYRFWEANSTAYMAMPYYDGQTLRDNLRERTSPPDEAWLKKILDPITEALGIIHEQNCFHRDIAPDNIMLLRDGRPVLLDFGAARRVISDMTQALTVILKPGYAPIEQYAEMPGMKQGAWTDIYALAAVCYFSIAKKLPPPSVSRIVQDSYEPLADIAAGRYSNTFLRGLDHCLAVKPENRPQTMAEMRDLIGINMRPAPQAAPPAATPTPKATPDLAFELEQPKSPAAPASAAPQAAQARPTPVSRPPVEKPAPRRVPAIDPDEQRTPKAASSKAPLFIGLGVLALAAAGGAGWYVTQQQNANAPQASTSAPQISPPVIQSPIAPPPPVIMAPISAPAPAESPASAAASQAVEALTAKPEPVKVEPQPARLEPINPPAQPVKKPVTKPVEPKPAKPAKPAGEAGDKAERDYMKQLNKDLDNLLK